MGAFVKGDVVVMPFPFSNLQAAKKRPALVLVDLEGDDIIVCQITTNRRRDRYSVSLVGADFANGGIDQDSVVRPNRIFTAEEAIILRKAGNLTSEKIDEVVEKIIDILRN